MIYWTVESTPVPGKEGEAIEFLKKMAQHVIDTSGGAVQVEVVRRTTGPATRLLWLEKQKSLAAWEEHDNWFNGDATSMELIKGGEGLFADAEVHFWQIL